MSDDGFSGSTTVPASTSQTLSLSTSMTSPTTSLPAPDNVLFDPATLFRPAFSTVSRSHSSSPTMTAVFPASPDKLSTVNRPVKRSTSETTLPLPQEIQDTSVSRISSTSSSLLCPPSSQKLLSKRVFEAPSFPHEDRSSKRANLGQSNALLPPCASVRSDIPSKQRHSLQGRQSVNLSASSAFSTAFATTRPNTKGTDAKLFLPPSASAHHSAPVLLGSNAQVEDVSRASRLLSLPSTTPFPPSKSETTLPHDFRFNFDKQPTLSSSTFTHLDIRPSKTIPFALGPSPIRADEHVPRPPIEPVIPFALRSSSSNQAHSSLNASPSRVQAAFGNPFRRGPAHVTPKAAMDIPSSPPSLTMDVSSSISADLNKGASRPKASTSSSSTKPSSRPASPMQRDDLMRRTLEKNVPVETVLGMSHATAGTSVCATLPSNMSTSSQHPQQMFTRALPTAVTPCSPAKAASSVFETLSSTHQELRYNSAQGSPCKRPASPTQSDGRNMSEIRRTRHRKEETLSQNTREHSRRQSMRQASRTSLKESTATKSSVNASDYRKPIVSAKSRSSSVESESAAPIYRPASAGGSAPITRPTSFRSFSAPSMTVTHTQEEETDVFKAPSFTSRLPGRYRPRADVLMEEGDSAETLDADTSIMSTSGLSSLANLQSLLSKMSRPSISRRTSAAFPHPSMNLGRLAEHSESGSEQEPKPTSRQIAGLPRYAAPTSSSVARRSKGPNEVAETGDISARAPTTKPTENRKKMSSGVSEMRRGSLLPMAVNAAQRLTVRPDPPNTQGKQGIPTLKVDKVEKCQILKDVVAFVDVKTAEGDEAGGVFVDILRSLGARVRIMPL